jgi:hypothetical protein
MISRRFTHYYLPPFVWPRVHTFSSGPEHFKATNYAPSCTLKTKTLQLHYRSLSSLPKMARHGRLTTDISISSDPREASYLCLRCGLLQDKKAFLLLIVSVSNVLSIL